MPLDASLSPGVIAWWSPDPRCVLPLDNLRVTRSLRRSCKRYDVRIDSAFEEVINACAMPHRPGGWITSDIITAYTTLHRLGWAHSFEAWDLESNTLAGGLYGVSIGAFFAGESMFHLASDASKAALVELVSTMKSSGSHALLDVQWLTPHLESLGAIEIDRHIYLELLSEALSYPPPDELL